MTSKYFGLLSLIIFTVVFSNCKKQEDIQVDLSGEWSVTLDPNNLGEKEAWYKGSLENGKPIILPSTLDEAGIGEKVNKPANLDKETLYQLTRRYTYIGAAWYQKEINIPTSWTNKDISLEMERVIWKSQVWVDGSYKGTDNSLVSAHSINLGKLSPGRHNITICIDNREQHDIFDNAREIDLAHSYTETTQIKWNGILGQFKLKPLAAFNISNLQVYPSKDETGISVKIEGNGIEGTELKIKVSDKKNNIIAEKIITAATSLEFNINGNYKLWDEFHHEIYQIEVSNPLNEVIAERSFGLRKLESVANNMLINGKRIFLRGTLECCIFPLTGHPPLDDAEWQRVFGAAKSYGLNHLRFHSWCPPEAAFRIADQMGFYLQVEMPSWSLKYGEDSEMQKWMENEGRRMIRDYGNHPSFCMMALGNELQGDFSKLSSFVKELQSSDTRHLYTTTAFTFQNPYSKTPNSVDEYWITQWTKDGWVRGQGVFDTEIPSFNKDYKASIEFLDIPLITHEIGQYSVYPSMSEIDKYTGVLNPLNFKAIKADLATKGRLNKADQYQLASGHLAKILYKEEVERALKTPGISGFQMLDLHDFPGQGTALVGLLDAFWDSKGIISGDDFKQFCSELVPLIKFEKAVYTQDETFKAKAEVANYWKDIKEKHFKWTIKDGDAILADGILPNANVAQGSYAEIGDFEFNLKGIVKASKLDVTLTLEGTGYANSWSIWVYPSEQKINTGEVNLTSDWGEAQKMLAEGKKVFFSPRLSEIKGITGKFVSVFWSPVHFPNQPGTMGLLIDTEHTALNEFPTEFHTNWQWWDLCKKSKTLNVEDLKYTPIVTVVDNFFKNRELTNLFEVKIGQGSLVFSSINLHSDLANRPTAKCLLSSIVNYMNSDKFTPTATTRFSNLESLFRKEISTKDQEIGKLYDEDGF